MEETRITGQLPNLDIEFTRSEAPDGGSETITMRMTATPSFEAFGEHISQMGTLPFGPQMMAPWLTAAPLAPMMAPMLAPMQIWSQMAQAAWAPWLGARTLPGPGKD